MSYLEHLRAKRSLRDRTDDGHKETCKEARRTERTDAVPESVAETNAGVGVRKDAKKANEADKAYQTAQSTIPPFQKKEEKGRGVTEQAFPDLPWEIKRLLAAAASDVLQADVPGVPDVGRYTLALGASYLTGDREEALRRLWQVYRAWKSPI